MAQLMALCPKYMQLNIPRSVVSQTKCKMVIAPSLSFHTCQTQYLRKAPNKSWKLLGVQWAYLPWPSYFIKALIRRRIKPETLGPTEAHRKSTFHRLSIFYVFVTWTACGVAGWMWIQPKTKEELDEEKKRINALPHQDEINRGGAMWWVNTLKKPDEMEDVSKIKVMKFSGFSYKGLEDVTLKVKEIGQERNRRDRELMEESNDYYLRKLKNIKLEKDGGPTNQQLRDEIKAQGKDYELELDWANKRFRVRTNYNADGTVGAFQTKDDMREGNVVPEPELAQ